MFCAYRPCLALKRRRRRRGSSLSVALVGLDRQQSTLTLPELEAHAGQNSAKEHGAVHVFEGALPGDVLAKVGAPAGKTIRGV